MSRNIKLKIADSEYVLIANDEQMESMMRLAAEEINAMLAQYDAKFPDKSLVEKLAFVALNKTVSKLKAFNKYQEVAAEVNSLFDVTRDYLQKAKK